MAEETLADYTAAIAALHEQMRPLRDQVAALARDREALADLLAEDDTTSDRDLVEAARHSGRASRKLEDRARALHPDLCGYSEFLPAPEDYTHGYILGPHITAPAVDADAAHLAGLADALVTYAARFCPVLPPNTTPAGLVPCAILLDDYGTERAWHLRYEPVPGGRAELRNDYWPFNVLATGTLVEILATIAAQAPSRDTD